MRGRTGVLLVLLAGAAAAAFFLFRGGEDVRDVTHAEFVTAVDDTCADLVAAGRALEPPYRPYGPHAESYFADFLAQVESAKGRLQGVDPPGSDDGAHSTLVDGYTQIETDLEEAQGAAATEQDPEVLARIAEIEMTAQRMAGVERALGACEGGTSVAALPGLLRRTVPNPLSETGEF